MDKKSGIFSGSGLTIPRETQGIQGIIKPRLDSSTSWLASRVGECSSSHRRKNTLACPTEFRFLGSGSGIRCRQGRPGSRTRFPAPHPRRVYRPMALHQPAADQVGGNEVRWRREEGVVWHNQSCRISFIQSQTSTTLNRHLPA